MNRTLPPRWSKKTDELMRHVAQRLRPSLQSELGHWLEESPRFRAFLTRHQDKVRKKLTSTDDDEHRLNVRAELLVAHLILADRRFEVAFEAYGSGRRGPDFTLTFRANQRLNLEVTRLQATGDPGADRLANVIVGKLQQLPAEVPNALVIVGRGLSLDEDALAAAPRLLKAHADAQDDAFFVRRGFATLRDLYSRYARLGGVFVIDEAQQHVTFWANREARHPLPKDAAAALVTCLEK
jgi:hypothetical protein